MKKLLLIALLTVLTATVGHAASDVIVDGVTYEWYENSVAHQYGYIATGWDEETPIQSLHIRGEVDGYQVFGIEDYAFSDITDIEYLKIDEGVTYIGEYAFSRCTNLKVAILPEGLKTIRQFAFEFDSLLTTMVIPSTVTEIQAHAFSYCTGVTDVYFLMDDTQLQDFEGWWDGIYRDAINVGGTEFNGSRLAIHNPENGTHCHVPQGMLEAYQASGEFDEWLLDEDSNCYPLWWIVNFGVVGREYTVSDALAAVYVDVDGGLYAKDDNHWLTPDRAYPGEIDYMKNTGLMDEHEGKRYDQSNWVVLTNVKDPDDFIGYLINGETITGILTDKRNPVIAVSDEVTLEIGDQSLYEKNVYIPASFMGRAQLSPNGRTYAFVQPKPQELIHVDWTIYSDDDECFYLPEPDEDNGINTMELAGGIRPHYDLYEELPVPGLVDCGIYDFVAINRRTIFSDNKNLLRSQEAKYTPYTAGGVSDKFIVYPLELPEDAPLTGVVDVVVDFTQINKGWFTIDGRSLGDTKPTTPGFYINGNRKILIR